MYDKENAHPNRPRVYEDDFSKISKQYVLDGQRLRVKSIRYRQDPITQTPPPISKPQLSPAEVAKLEYLEKMGVITPDEQIELDAFRETQPREEMVPLKQRQAPTQRQVYKGPVVHYDYSQQLCERQDYSDEEGEYNSQEQYYYWMIKMHCDFKQSN